MTLRSVPTGDAVRLDVSKARRWVVAHGFSRLTVVVATTEDEARAIGAVWFARREGRTYYRVPEKRDFRVRPATDQDVESFLALLAQDRAGKAGVAR